MVKIRFYKKEDYPDVSQILKEADLFDSIWDSEENLSGMIAKDPETILVATEDDNVVGNVFLMYYGPKLQYLFRLAVKKEFRQKGIATRLIEEAMKMAVKRKANEVGMYVDASNLNLQSFYKKRGFKKSKSSYFYMWKEYN
jgi:ribosomal protein S18 acetylase RimI-like enzyme